MRTIIKRIWLPVAIAVGAVVYFLIDPMTAPWMPKCIFKAITGFDCPGCGSQRMVHALLHLDFPAAWHANALLLSMLPYLAGLFIVSIAPTKYPKLAKALHHPIVIWTIAVGIIVWTIVRNF